MVNPLLPTPPHPLLSVWVVPPITIWQSLHRFKTFPPSGRRWQELLHMLRCLFRSLAVWVAEQLRNCPQETNGHMARAKVPYKSVRPFVLWHGGAPGNVQSVRSDDRQYRLITAHTSTPSTLNHSEIFQGLESAPKPKVSCSDCFHHQKNRQNQFYSSLFQHIRDSSRGVTRWICRVIRWLTG